ncbi:cell division protein ZapA [Sphingoaurantiacus capsulatus]|uniref:Cell division protein ZapA n=1 Tax=Sphingoaurantiacus capsulatus TaxID=1771310 RepID=A0ABV7XG68_9SPHN
MGQINVTIGGRSYGLACRDGEEMRLTRLACHLADKAGELEVSLGQMSEPRLLLMAGILVTDELFDLRETPGGAQAAADARVSDAINKVAERLEKLAASLEAEAGTP